MLPTPRTSFVLSLPRNPPNGMGTTLGSDSGLDQDKTLACRTFGTPPRRPLEPPGRRRDLRETKDDAQDDSHA